MFSSFSKFLPTNVNITTPDFLKSATHNTSQSPEATSTPTDAKHRNVLTKPKASNGGQPDSQISTMDTVSVNDSENANHVDNPVPRSKNESKSRKRKDASTATEVSHRLGVNCSRSVSLNSNKIRLKARSSINGLMSLRDHTAPDNRMMNILYDFLVIVPSCQWQA